VTTFADECSAKCVKWA